MDKEKLETIKEKLVVFNSNISNFLNKNKKIINKIFLILGVVIVLALIGYYIYLIFSAESKKAQNPYFDKIERNYNLNLLKNIMPEEKVKLKDKQDNRNKAKKNLKPRIEYPKIEEPSNMYDINYKELDENAT